MTKISTFAKTELSQEKTQRLAARHQIEKGFRLWNNHKKKQSINCFSHLDSNNIN